MSLEEIKKLEEKKEEDRSVRSHNRSSEEDSIRTGRSVGGNSVTSSR